MKKNFKNILIGAPPQNYKTIQGNYNWIEKWYPKKVIHNSWKSFYFV